MSGPAMDRLIELLPGLDYDICVLTGDYRGKTFGPFTASLEGVARVRAQLGGPSMACWETTIPSAWSPSSRTWASACC